MVADTPSSRLTDLGPLELADQGRYEIRRERHDVMDSRDVEAVCNLALAVVFFLE